MDYWGAKGYVGPPLKILGGGAASPGPLLPTPMTIDSSCSEDKIHSEISAFGSMENFRETKLANLVKMTLFYVHCVIKVRCTYSRTSMARTPLGP